MTHDHLKTFIDSAYEHAVEITPETKGVVRDAVDEVLDLLAFLLSRGDRNSPMFQ